MTDAPSVPARARRIRRTRDRATAIAMALVLACAAVGAAQPAAALAADPAMQETYRAQVNGDYRMIGNGSLIASRALSGAATPSQLHAGAPGAYNDHFAMEHVQHAPALERAGAANSSSAVVEIPAGAAVVHATLAWSGNSGHVAGRGDGYCSTGTLPARLPSEPLDGTAMVQVGDGPVASVRGTVTTDAATIGYYSARADVTALFVGVATGAPQRVSVGDLWLPQGANCFGGWTISLVYDFGRYVPGVPESAARSVTLSHGHVRVDGSSSTLLPYNGFRVVADGVRASFALGEGDAAIAGDFAEYRAGTTGAFTRIPGATGATDNIGTGYAASAVRFQGEGTQRFHNASIDVVDVALDRVPAGTTDVQLQLGTASDAFLLQSAAFSVPVAAVELDGGSGESADVRTMLPGQRPALSFTVRNPGSAPLTSVRVEAPAAPDCARELPALAPGAEHSFSCLGPEVGPEGAHLVVTVRASAGSATVADERETTVLVSAIDVERAGEVTVGDGEGRAPLQVRNAGSSALAAVSVHATGACMRPVAIDWSTSSDPSTPAGTLAPGETVRATAACALASLTADGEALATARGGDAAGNVVEDVVDLAPAMLAAAPVEPTPQPSEPPAPEPTPTEPALPTPTPTPTQPAPTPTQPAPSPTPPATPAPQPTPPSPPTPQRPDPAPAVPQPPRPDPASPGRPSPGSTAPGQAAPGTTRPAPPVARPNASRPDTPVARGELPAAAAPERAAPELEPAVEAPRQAPPGIDELSSSVDSYVVTAVNTGSTPLVDVTLGGVPAALAEFAAGWLASVAALAPGQSVTTSVIAGMPPGEAARSGAVLPGWGGIVPPLGVLLSALALVLALVRRRRRA